MRNILWPESIELHANEIQEFFDNKSIDIVETYVIERDNSKLAGFIELNIRNFAEGSRSPEVPYVEAWFIDEDCRAKGLGTQLMETAEAWALKKGYSELASDTETFNEYSISLHQKLGFKETDRVVCFLKKLR